MQDITIGHFEESQLERVADLLAHAYLKNPLQVVVFGGSGAEQLRQHRVLFELSLPVLNTGTKLVVLRGSSIAGFAHWVASPGCRPSPETFAGLAPRLLQELGEEVVSRMITWRRAWGEQDPDAPHSHFGPFAVDPQFQGQGFGRALMERYCTWLDERGETAYLETERPANVPLYRKSGFEVTREIEVLGLPSWFLTRRPRSRSAG